MKVATACILCLIMTVVNGSLFRFRSEVNEVDGQPVIQCSIEWGGTKYTANLGESLQLPSVGGGPCYDCGSCDPSGMECAQVFRGRDRPGCPSYGPYINEDK